jgi:hypothetical protein
MHVGSSLPNVNAIPMRGITAQPSLYQFHTHSRFFIHRMMVSLPVQRDVQYSTRSQEFPLLTR